MKFKLFFFITLLILTVSQLFLSGCGFVQGKKISGTSGTSGKPGLSGTSDAAGSESAQTEESADTIEVKGSGAEKTPEEVLAEDMRLKEEALAKEKKDKELMDASTAGSEAVASADPIKPEGNCDLVIITPPEFISALTSLKEHKNNTGIITKIISLEDIYTSYKGRDEAEKVKYFLADYSKTAGLKYAMLVGDADKFPIRFTKTDRATAAAFDTAYYGADLYYADLFKADGSFDDWDNNKNGFFGELAGETKTGPLNVDKVDLVPDIAVGRVPASNADEVARYAAKVISYENDGSKSSYINDILLVSTKDPSLSELFCGNQDKIAKELLKSKNVTKLYDLDKEFFDNKWQQKYTPGEYDKILAEKVSVNAGTINDYLNKGIGFLSYMGHGNKDVWANIYTTEYVSSLNNSGKPTIIFTGGCGTAEFATLPPYSAYLDINGVYHQGTNNGEVFTQTPPQPACIQQENNPESLAEYFTVYYDVGAVGYLGFITGAQGYAATLNYGFFEGIKNGKPTLGDIWNYMTKQYYKVEKFPSTISSPDWWIVAGFHQPWKLFLFGDPSLRIGSAK
jgi:hypothetical protein